MLISLFHRLRRSTISLWLNIGLTYVYMSITNWAAFVPIDVYVRNIFRLKIILDTKLEFRISNSTLTQTVIMQILSRSIHSTERSRYRRVCSNNSQLQLERFVRKHIRRLHLFVPNRILWRRFQLYRWVEIPWALFAARWSMITLQLKWCAYGFALPWSTLCIVNSGRQYHILF